ncbi:hypothetical protein J2T17_005160 [Paenibacillus mucilaginosus]
MDLRVRLLFLRIQGVEGRECPSQCRRADGRTSRGRGSSVMRKSYWNHASPQGQQIDSTPGSSLNFTLA